VPWLLGFGEAGYLADMTDPRGLAQVIHRVLGSPDEATSKGALALERARSQFTLQTMAEAYEGLLRGLCPERS
jgi:glycosyltransferase involved in cell wall biosynthesis